MAIQFTKAKIVILIAFVVLITVVLVVAITHNHKVATMAAADTPSAEATATAVNSARAKAVLDLQRLQTQLQTGPKVNIRASLIEAVKIKTSLDAVYEEVGPAAQAEQAALAAQFATLDRQIRAGLDTALITTSSIKELLITQRDATNGDIFISEAQSQTIQDATAVIQAAIIIDETDLSTQMQASTTSAVEEVEISDDTTSTSDALDIDTDLSATTTLETTEEEGVSDA